MPGCSFQRSDTLFFLIVLTAAWSLYRWVTIHKVFLLLASYVFFGLWIWRYVPLLALISIFSALVAQGIRHCDPGRRQPLSSCLS
jgi:hypothetical protein